MKARQMILIVALVAVLLVVPTTCYARFTASPFNVIKLTKKYQAMGLSGILGVEYVVSDPNAYAASYYAGDISATSGDHAVYVYDFVRNKLPIGAYSLVSAGHNVQVYFESIGKEVTVSLALDTTTATNHLKVVHLKDGSTEDILFSGTVVKGILLGYIVVNATMNNVVRWFKFAVIYVPPEEMERVTNLNVAMLLMSNMGSPTGGATYGIESITDSQGNTYPVYVESARPSLEPFTDVYIDSVESMFAAFNGSQKPLIDVIITTGNDAATRFIGSLRSVEGYVNGWFMLAILLDAYQGKIMLSGEIEHANRLPTLAPATYYYNVSFWRAEISIYGQPDVAEPSLVIRGKVVSDDNVVLPEGAKVTGVSIYIDEASITSLLSRPLRETASLAKLYEEGKFTPIYKIYDSSISPLEELVGPVWIDERTCVVGSVSRFTAPLPSPVTAPFYMLFGLAPVTVTSTSLYVPFKAPIIAYRGLKADVKLDVVDVSYAFDSEGNKLALTVGFVGSAGAAGAYGVLTAASKALAEMAAAPVIDAEDLIAASELLAQSGALAGASTAAAAVGAVIVADTVYSAIAAPWLTQTFSKMIYVQIPIYVDVRTGKRYGAVMVYAPNAFLIPQLSELYASSMAAALLNRVAEKYKLDGIYYEVKLIGNSWDEYKSIVRKGALPQPDLVYLAEKVAEKYGVNPDYLVLEGILIEVESCTAGAPGLLQTITGGIRVNSTMILHFDGIQVNGMMNRATISDARILKYILNGTKIIADGKEIPLEIVNKTKFTIEAIPKVPVFGAKSIKLEMPILGLKIKGRIVTSFEYQVPLDFDGKRYYKTVKFPENAPISYVGFHGMPVPPKRIIHSVNDVHSDVTNLFSVVKWGGKYVASSLTVDWIDPELGNMMRKGVSYTFEYWIDKTCVGDNDVGITGAWWDNEVLPRNMMLNVTSSVPNNVVIEVKIYEKAGDAMRELGKKTVTLSFEKAGTKVARVDVSREVTTVMEDKNWLGDVALVAEAKIVSADKNSLGFNDKARLVWVPSAAAYVEAQMAQVYIKVINATTAEPIPSALVEVYDMNGTLVAGKLTNATGYASFTLKTGYYRVAASKDPWLTAVNVHIYKTPYTLVLPLGERGVPVEVSVVYADGYPVENATIVVYQNALFVLSTETDSTGKARFRLEPGLYNISAVVGLWSETKTVNVTPPLTRVTFTLPYESGKGKPLMALVRTWIVDPIYGNIDRLEGMNITVCGGPMNITMFAGVTDAKGELWVKLPAPGLYQFIATKGDMKGTTVAAVYRNNTIVDIVIVPPELRIHEVGGPLGPYPPDVTAELPLPLASYNITNATTGEVETWHTVIVRVVYADGVPVMGANVTFYDLTGVVPPNATTVNTSLAVNVISMLTGADGYAFASFKNDSVVYINVTVPWFGYSAGKLVHVVEPIYEEFTVPHSAFEEKNVTLPYNITPWADVVAPEVAVIEVKLHPGVGAMPGILTFSENLTESNILVEVVVYSNVNQTITLNSTLFEVTNETKIKRGSTKDNVGVTVGTNTILQFVKLLDVDGGWYQALSNITSYENDTELANNYAWSDKVFIKPLVDISVDLMWAPILQKNPYAILPGDYIDVECRIRCKTPCSDVPVVLSIESFNVKRGEFEMMEFEKPLPITVLQSAVVWRNVTVRVPWTDEVKVKVNVSSPYDIYPYDNMEELTIPVDPNVMVKLAGKPPIVIEGQKFKLAINVTANVRPGVYVGSIYVEYGNKSIGQILGFNITPSEILEVEVEAPKFGDWWEGIVNPYKTIELTVSYSGIDFYEDDNSFTTQVTMMSTTSFSFLLGLLILLIVVFVALGIAVKVLARVGDYVPRRFVRRKKKGFVFHK